MLPLLFVLRLRFFYVHLLFPFIEKGRFIVLALFILVSGRCVHSLLRVRHTTGTPLQTLLIGLSVHDFVCSSMNKSFALCSREVATSKGWEGGLSACQSSCLGVTIEPGGFKRARSTVQVSCYACLGQIEVIYEEICTV